MYEDLKELLGRNVDLVVDRTLAPFAWEFLHNTQRKRDVKSNK